MKPKKSDQQQISACSLLKYEVGTPMHHVPWEVNQLVGLDAGNELSGSATLILTYDNSEHMSDGLTSLTIFFHTQRWFQQNVYLYSWSLKNNFFC